MVAAVAGLVKNKLDPKPEFVITLGDNNYDRGKAGTIKANVTDHYGGFIKPGKDNRRRGHRQTVLGAVSIPAARDKASGARREVSD